MATIEQKKLWPYDEVTVARSENSPSGFVVSAPWLSVQFDVAPEHLEKAQAVINKIAAGSVAAEDLAELSWFFGAVTSYPFCYSLPRHEVFGKDLHQQLTQPLDMSSPKNLLFNMTKQPHMDVLSENWTWDTEAALGFCQTEGGYDPESLFSVARRFHLLNDLESNKTAELLEYLAGLEKKSALFRDTSALVMRQNHYITEKCEEVLSAALPLAQTAQDEVKAFIRAESGHDKILKKALFSMGLEAKEVPVLDCVTVLMELFRTIAARNFLAFSMVVDIFERSSYTSEDPFANVLKSGGHDVAATQIAAHREINDMGGHENVAVGFLQHMQPVSAEYAVEALRLAELLTQVIHSISKDTLTKAKSS